MNIPRCLNRLLPGAQWSLDGKATDLSSLVFHDGTHAVPTMADLQNMQAIIDKEDMEKIALEAKFGHIPSFLQKLCAKLSIDPDSI